MAVVKNQANYWFKIFTCCKSSRCDFIILYHAFIL